MDKYKVILSSYGTSHLLQVANPEGILFPIVHITNKPLAYAEHAKQRLEDLIKVVYLDGQNNPLQGLVE